MDEKPAMNSNTLCPLAWNHFSVNLDTSMRICCNTHNGGHILNPDGDRYLLSAVKGLDEYYNTAYYKEVRVQMMSGERPGHCHNCFTMEDHGALSLRQIYLQHFMQQEKFREQLSSTKPDGTIIPQVTYLDFSLGNKCNLKCVMCNPVASTILRNDFDDLGWAYDKEFFSAAENGWKDEDTILKTFELCLPTLQEMLFTGGEPLVSNLHMRILETAVAKGYAKDIVLRYHSNCTNVPARIVEIWPMFKIVELHASVEAAGELNDYIRYGSDFSVIEKNIIKIAELKNTRVEIHTCFQIPTILNLTSLHEWVANLHPKIPQIPYHIWVNHPQWLEAHNLPKELKKFARARIESHLEKFKPTHHHEWYRTHSQQLLSLLSRMEAQDSDSNLWHEFKRKISELEGLRGNSLKKLTPELFL